MPFLLDTNIIMAEPYISERLSEPCYVCSTVLFELDKHKTRNDEKGRNIREFARALSENKLKNIKTDILSTSSTISNDVSIILTAKNNKLTLLTNDRIMYIISMTYGAKAKILDEFEKNDVGELYAGFYKTDLLSKDYIKNNNLPPNAYLLASDGLFCYFNGKLKRIRKNLSAFSIKPRNVGQTCVLDALLNPDIKLVTITGKAGSGKTLLSTASMLDLTIKGSLYEKILIARPIIPMGNDLGYLPGDMEEKLSPWLQPIFDNLEVILGKTKKKQNYQDLIDSGILEIGALTYIRGRSIPNQIILIDEAQNLSKHELITILTRVGEGTKIILTGDIEQIDSPRLDSVSNGLSYAIEKFKDQPIAAHVTLTKCERSELADISSKIL